MDWITLSLLSALSVSAYTIVQKYAFQRQLSSFVAFAFWGALFHLGIAVIILIAKPLPVPWASLPVLMVLGVGVLNAGYTLLINRVIQGEDEISRVVPVVDTYPVFIAILAVLLLGEALTPLKWLAMGLVISGAVLASWHQALPGERVKLGSSFFLLLLASLGIAVYSVATKYALGYLSFWHVYALSWVASAPAFVLAAHMLHAWHDVGMGASSIGSLVTTMSAHAMLFAAFVSGFMAFALGPVSLSSAIMASRPIIVLAYATLVGIFLPKVLAERTSRRAMLEQGLAASLVTLGVGAIAFL
ncbi:MAG: EamA family transporter [Chloroflexi bacterium]|nr:EamA family transporter [Chloroflexota bacterium]